MKTEFMAVRVCRDCRRAVEHLIPGKGWVRTSIYGEQMGTYRYCSECAEVRHAR